MKNIFVLLIIFSVVIFGCKQATNTSMEKEDGTMNIQLTGDECVAKGGEIVNTLSNPKYDKKLLLGEVVGMKCPCVCLKKDDSMIDKGYSGKVLAGTTTPYIDFNRSDYEKALKEKKKILLYFYASWCPICRAEQPETFAAFNEINDADLIGFRVNYRDSETDADEESLAKKFGVGYQHTKVILVDGERAGKWPDSWNKERYLEELGKI